MGTYAKQGSFTLNTATGTQSITGLGFTPKLVIFWGHQIVSKDGAMEVRRSYGAASSSTSTEQFVALTSLGQYNGYMHRRMMLGRCFEYNDANSETAICYASFVSMDSNGFTINVNLGAAVSVNYLALGGTSFKGKVGYFDIPATSDPLYTSTTGVGFKPGAVMFINGIQNTVDPMETVDYGDGFSFGFAAGTDPSLQECNTHFHQFDNPLSKRSNMPGYCIGMMGYYGDGYDCRGTLNSFDTDGFTIYYDAKWGGSVVRTYYVALGGTATYSVGAVTEPGSLGTQTVSAGMKPIAQIFTSIGAPNGPNTFQNDSLFSFGAATNASSAQQAAATFSSVDGISSNINDSTGTNTTSGALTSSPIRSTTPNSLGTVTSNTFTGFTVNWTTVSSTNIRYSYLAIGDSKISTSRMMIGLFH